MTDWPEYESHKVVRAALIIDGFKSTSPARVFERTRHAYGNTKKGDMNVERLERMILILEEVERANAAFGLNDWAVGNPCGTSCCAMGYAGLDPEFQKQGLYLEVELYRRRRDRGGRINIVCKPASVEAFNDLFKPGVYLRWANPVLVRPDHEARQNGLAAAMKFFGISHDDAQTLFLPTSYEEHGLPVDDPRVVIDQIKKLLAREKGG